MRHLVVMLKEPKAGQVKTRLGRDIGMVNAAWWFRHQTAALLRRLEDPRWQLWLSVSPDKAGLSSRVWPSHLPKIPQGGGVLGDRMARIMKVMPKGQTCIIGGDIPGISNAAIERAFRTLGDHEAVFGPAHDGGYWLIGLKRTRPAPVGFLQNVRWSTEHALDDSIESLADRSVGCVDQLQDVDTAEDLLALSR